MGSKNIAFGVGSALVIIVAGASLAFSTTGPTRTAERTTLLRDGLYEFDGAPEPAVFGRLTSIADEDALLRVTLYRTPAATGVEEKESIAGAPRTQSGSQWIEGAITATDFCSGDMVRAVYETLDAEGVLIHSSERSWRKP